jgi:uridylate kinase
MKQSLIISLGGSLIVPDGIDAAYLKEFHALITSHLNDYKQIMIVAGGGKTARRYQEAARDIIDTPSDDLDWLGIHASRLNGHLLRTIFRDVADPEMLNSPEKMTPRDAKVLIAAGYRPGHSTDFVATLLAQSYGVKTVVNLSNIDYVYDKDPRQHTDAKPLERISWADFRTMVGDVWTPGKHVPFDPVAAKLGQELGLTVAVMNGKNIENLRDFLAGKPAIGTRIEP